MTTFLLIGGLVAVGFDPTGEYLLVISHSGRGVFSIKTWTRVARDVELSYPESGIGVGIGPIEINKFLFLKCRTKLDTSKC